MKLIYKGEIPNFKPLKSWIKKTILIVAVIFLAFGLSAILISMPFKNNRSALDWIIAKFQKDDWDSGQIVQAVLYSLTWIALVWNFSARIAELILYKKKKRLYEVEATEKGISPYGKNEKRRIMFSIKEKEKHTNYVLDKIVEACAEIQLPLKGTSIFEIREILEKLDPKNPRKARSERLSEIKDVLKLQGVNVDNPKIIKALKLI